MMGCCVCEVVVVGMEIVVVSLLMGLLLIEGYYDEVFVMLGFFVEIV